MREVYPHTGKAAVVGFTGPPGVGKSTLIGALTKARREAGRTVGVLSIDPSSPFTQGALLGDRIRLAEHFLDPGVFIRSMANRGALGGLSEAALQAALLLDAAGREDVFVETVGVGQAEIDIIDHADTIVLVLMPGSGDSIQALKAGVMEIPDVIVINKADHPLTDTMVREIRGVLSLANLDRSPRRCAGGWRVPIVKTEAAHGEGVEELVERLDEHRAHILAAGQLQERRRRNLRNEVLAIATARMRRRLEEELGEDAEFQRLLDEVVARRLDPASAATALLERDGGVGSAAMAFLDWVESNWGLLGPPDGRPHQDLPRHRRAGRPSHARASRRCCCSTTWAPRAERTARARWSTARTGRTSSWWPPRAAIRRTRRWYYNLVAHPDTTVQVGSRARATSTRAWPAPRSASGCGS